MPGVEHPELHELVGLDVGGDQHVEILEREPVGGEAVLDDPLSERLGHDRPVVDDAVGLGEPAPVGVGRRRGDAVDHAVGEGDRALDPRRQLVAEALGLAEGGGTGDGPVADDVVAAHDGEPAAGALSAPVQAGGDDPERRGGAGGRRVGLVYAGAVVDRVPALGDGDRHDLGGVVGDGIDEALGVGGGVDVVDDAADDGDVGRVGSSRDQGVEVVLRPERARHRRIAGQHARTDDRPVALSASTQLVHVGGEVGTVEPAHAHVHDASPEAVPLVVGRRHRRGQPGERTDAQGDRFFVRFHDLAP